MSRITAPEAFAHITSALVGQHDLAGVLADLLDDCTTLTSSAACGLLIADGDAGLQLLSATSHSVSELELYQAQIAEGPCVDAWRTGETVSAAGKEDVESRWSAFGPSMTVSGFGAVLAQPLAWHNTPIGALNLFRAGREPFDDNQLLLARTFTDLATVLIVHNDVLSIDQALERASAALSSRTVIEQAKGVLSHLHTIDMADAYERLRVMATESGRSLTHTAEDIVIRALRR